ncbi:MAG: copper resistance CopC family protein [Gemmatimonadota bacterium]
MTVRSVVRRSLVVVLAAAMPVVAGASLLHLKLSRSEPTANAVLPASPTQVKLWFTQKPELTVTSIKVKSGSGATAVERALAPLARGVAAGAPITAPIGAALAPGHYEVVWRTMARDGHVLNGVIPFDVRAAR